MQFCILQASLRHDYRSPGTNLPCWIEEVCQCCAGNWSPSDEKPREFSSCRIFYQSSVSTVARSAASSNRSSSLNSRVIIILFFFLARCAARTTAKTSTVTFCCWLSNCNYDEHQKMWAPAGATNAPYLKKKITALSCKAKCGDLLYNKSELLQQQSSKSSCHRLFLLPSVVLYPRKKNWLRPVLQYIRDNILLHSKCCVIIITTSTTVVSSSSSSSHLSSSGCRVATTKIRTITLVRFLIAEQRTRSVSSKDNLLFVCGPDLSRISFLRDVLLSLGIRRERERESSVSIFVFHLLGNWTSILYKTLLNAIQVICLTTPPHKTIQPHIQHYPSNFIHCLYATLWNIFLFQSSYRIVSHQKCFCFHIYF